MVAVALAGYATAAPDCGERVLLDWSDNGRVDRVYPLRCYEEAIDALPTDLRDYTDAEDVIERALQSAVRGSPTAAVVAAEEPGSSSHGGIVLALAGTSLALLTGVALVLLVRGARSGRMPPDG